MAKLAKKWLKLKQSKKPHICGIRRLRVNAIWFVKTSYIILVAKIAIKNNSTFFFAVCWVSELDA